MILFLTSSPCDDNVPDGADLPCILNEENQFVENLEKIWKENSQCLIISADPDNYELNDEMADTFWKAFSFHGLTLEDLVVCDSRNEEDLPELLEQSDVIVLSGGHVPTEHAFFERIGLREQIWDFKGIVIGISAGTMNCANIVYAQPELEGESVDPDYERYLPGLGLTPFMILPHYQQVKDYMLDGRRLYEDITFEDSFGNQFIVLVDGSYLIVRDSGRTELYGEAYLIEDGEMTQICEKEDRIVLVKEQLEE